jgi:hypothetical protein
MRIGIKIFFWDEEKLLGRWKEIYRGEGKFYMIFVMKK